MQLHVIKRDGSRVLYKEEYIHKIVGYACENIENVSLSDIVLHAGIQAYDGITTAEIHDLLIKSSADRISEFTPNYQYVAANLNVFKIRKIAYGKWMPPSLFDHVKKMCEDGWYDAELLKKYSKEEFDELDKALDHKLDLTFSYAATKQLEGKYLLKNRVTGKLLESPQMSFMCIALAIFQDFGKNTNTNTNNNQIIGGSLHNQTGSCENNAAKNFINSSNNKQENIENNQGTNSNTNDEYVYKTNELTNQRINTERLEIVKEFYKNLAQQNISLPTPIMAGARTALRQFSSCVLIECGDSLDSISATGSAIIGYVSRMAGIGINAGQIRAKGSPVRNGAIYHTGITPFLKFFQSAVQSCSAGGVRVGSATVYYPIWHYEVEDLLVMKNNRGTEENRVRHMDYSVAINGFFYKRLQMDKNITLFSPHEVPDLYQAFFADQDLFAQLYLQYEKNENIKMKKTIKSSELFASLMKERSSTGRIYIMHTDHCNTHSSFNPKRAPIKQSNLCAEVTLPTKPISSVDKTAGEIGLCVLSAINVGKIGLNEKKMQKCTQLLVYALDELIDYQSYPLTEAEHSTKERRSIGIGVINYANFLAQNGCKFSDMSGLQITHDLFEMFQFYCIKASVELAKLKGKCAKFSDTKYSQGLLPIDTYYKKGIDKIIPNNLKMDWEGLRQDVLTFGMRNSALTALMPSETSSQVSNSTNGIEPPRGLISVKQSRDGILKQVVPDIDKIGHNYELLWQIKDNLSYLSYVGIMQKFIDQSISTNTHYDPNNYLDGRIPIQIMLRDLLYAYSIGIKTLYYHNTRDNASEEQIIADTGCASGACKI